MKRSARRLLRRVRRRLTLRSLLTLAGIVRLSGPVGHHLNAFRIVVGAAALASLFIGRGAVSADVVVGVLAVLNFACVLSWRRVVVTLDELVAWSERLAEEPLRPAPEAAARRLRDPQLAAMARALGRLQHRIARLSAERDRFARAAAPTIRLGPPRRHPSVRAAAPSSRVRPTR